MKRCFCALLLFLIQGLWFVASLQAQGEPFYQNKTIRIVVGSASGGVYDLWARLVAQHLGKNIPGNPNIIVQNMPGAGSMIAANYVYNVAKPDGLTLGSVSPALYFDQLVGRKEVQFDWAKFVWIGSPERSDDMIYFRSDTQFKSLEDIRRAPEPPRCGATGAASSTYYFPKLLEDALGLKLNIVVGYSGTADIDLAVERGELHCRGGTVTGFFGREPGRTWARTGFVRILVQSGSKRDPRLPDIPTIYELMEKNKTPEITRRLAKVILSPGHVGRPIVGTPGMPIDGVKVLREAYSKAIHDPEVRTEARKMGLELDPTSGEELETLAKEVILQPPEVVARMKKLLGK